MRLAGPERHVVSGAGEEIVQFAVSIPRSDLIAPTGRRSPRMAQPSTSLRACHLASPENFPHPGARLADGWRPVDAGRNGGTRRTAARTGRRPRRPGPLTGTAAAPVPDGRGGPRRTGCIGMDSRTGWGGAAEAAVGTDPALGRAVESIRAAALEVERAQAVAARLVAAAEGRVCGGGRRAHRRRVDQRRAGRGAAGRRRRGGAGALRGRRCVGSVRRRSEHRPGPAERPGAYGPRARVRARQRADRSAAGGPASVAVRDPAAEPGRDPVLRFGGGVRRRGSAVRFRGEVRRAFTRGRDPAPTLGSPPRLAGAQP